MNEHRFGTDPGVRASDADRERAGEQLRRSHAEGRLDVEEFQDRIDRCYAAKTVGELRALVADLPGEQPSDRAFGRPSLRGMRLIALLPVLLAVCLISAIIHGHGLWILVPLLLFTRFWLWGRRGRLMHWYASGGARRA